MTGMSVICEIARKSASKSQSVWDTSSILCSIIKYSSEDQPKVELVQHWGKLCIYNLFRLLAGIGVLAC